MDLELAVERLEVVDRLPASVGKPPDRRADHPLRVGEELVHGGRHGLRATPLAQLGQAPLGQPMRRELRPQVAAALVRVAHVGEHQRQHLVVQADGRDDQPLLEELARLGGEARRLHPAHVRVVRARDGEAARDTRDEGDVGEVRAAGVRVVDREDLARRRVAGHHRGDRLGHRAEVHGDVLGLRDHPARIVEDGGRAVAALLDV